MLFTSGVFFIFLLVAFAVYYLTSSGDWQLRWIIGASLFFYAFDQPSLLLLLLIVAFTDVIVSRRVITSPNPRGWAAAGVTFNLLVLAFFKYNHLLAATFPALAGIGSEPLRLLLLLPLPIGISFYTFHGISLLVDTLRPGPARNDVSSAQGFTEHMQNTLLYVSFFPQLIAGPIIKAHQFYPQIRHKHFQDINWEAAVQALIMGYFLKVVVADNLSQQTFWLTYPYFLSNSSLDLAVLLFGFSVQIFADFAGYSLIAIGLARLFGYELPRNFFFPYISETFSEFWTRWHISLSSWLRDYLYFPLGGNRKGNLRTYFNLLVVMGLGGLWHGAAWSYALWGLWHGCALVIERIWLESSYYRSNFSVLRIIRTLVVFTVVTIGWLLFKLPQFSHVVAFIRTFFVNTHAPSNMQQAMIIFLYSLPVIIYHFHYLYRRNPDIRERSRLSEGVARPILFGALLAAIAINPGPSKTFIYFQF